MTSWQTVPVYLNAASPVARLLDNNAVDLTTERNFGLRVAQRFTLRRRDGTATVQFEIDAMGSLQGENPNVYQERFREALIRAIEIINGRVYGEGERPPPRTVLRDAPQYTAQAQDAVEGKEYATTLDAHETVEIRQIGRTTVEIRRNRNGEEWRETEPQKQRPEDQPRVHRGIAGLARRGIRKIRSLLLPAPPA